MTTRHGDLGLDKLSACRFEHSDVISTNPYLVLQANVQNIAAWIDLITIVSRMVDLYIITQPPLFLYPPKFGMELCQWKKRRGLA